MCVLSTHPSLPSYRQRVVLISNGLTTMYLSRVSRAVIARSLAKTRSKLLMEMQDKTGSRDPKGDATSTDTEDPESGQQTKPKV